MTIADLITKIHRSPVQKTLHHFTEAGNIASIRSHGLLSRRTLNNRRLAHVTGGNQLSCDLDDHYGFDRYVHLCLRAQHGMAFQAKQEGRLVDVRWIAVSPDVLALPDVLIALDNSVKNDVPVVPLASALDSMDLEVLYGYTDWKDPAIQARLRTVERYEILVPDHVPLRYITF
jgi:hypothetical protein